MKLPLAPVEAFMLNKIKITQNTIKFYDLQRAM